MARHGLQSAGFFSSAGATTPDITRNTTMKRVKQPTAPVNSWHDISLQIKNLGLSGIAITIQRRAVQPGVVKQLAESMKNIGILNPITVRPREGGMGYYLIAGRYRLEAAKKLKWESVPCIILEGISADDAELREIDENLIRANLSPAEEAAITSGVRLFMRSGIPRRSGAATARARNQNDKMSIRKATPPTPLIRSGRRGRLSSVLFGAGKKFPMSRVLPAHRSIKALNSMRSPKWSQSSKLS
jgi:hypothetical protein